MQPTRLLPFVLAALASVTSAAPGKRARTTSMLKDFGGIPPLPTFAEIQASGSPLNFSDIQGDIVIGQKKPMETFIFFRITHAPGFKQVMQQKVLPLITSAQTLLGPAAGQPDAFVNVAFSQTGLHALGNNDNLGDPLFAAGQFADAAGLQDDITHWDGVFKNTNIHGVFLVGSDDDQAVTDMFNQILGDLSNTTNVMLTLPAHVRPGDQAGHEHFGYLDGVSQPGIEGVTVTPLPGQSMIPTGVILVGDDGDAVARPAWAKDGSFLAFRKLQQLVPEFKKFIAANPVQDASRNLTPQQGTDLLGARMFGRWPSGAPVDLSPLQDDPELGADPMRNNNFDFTHPGSDNHTDQSICPFTAHVRKVRPRGDLVPVNTLNQGFRSSITFGPEVSTAEMSSGVTNTERGLAFVMYQSNLANGFHFLQNTWANNPGFIFGKNITTVGQDLVIGQNGGVQLPRSNTGLDPTNFDRTIVMPQIVVPQGGEYFFSPTISALGNTLLV